MAKRIVSAVALVCVLAVAVPVAAQSPSWYAGAELGAARVEFRPYYQYPVGTPDQYFDRASGMEVALIAGREWALAPRLRLGALARFAYSDARWTLGITTGEHSTFTYRLGPSVAISAAPAFRISERVW